MNKRLDMIIWGMLLIIILSVFFLVNTCDASMDFVPDTEEKIERLVEAIGVAENGKNWKSKGVKYPYGIKSVKCEGIKECKRICRNTVVNNIKRWQKQSKHKEYLTFLWHRYCPPQKHALNKHWLNNVLRGL